MTPLERYELSALLDRYYSEQPTVEQNHSFYSSLVDLTEELHKAGHTNELQQIHDDVRAKHGLEPIDNETRYKARSRKANAV